MKKILIPFVPLLFFATLISAQEIEHKIVFDFTKADTANFATILRQVKNILNATGDAKLEVVCHGPGLDMLVKDKSTVQKEIEELHGKFRVVFAACEATMRRRGIEKNQLLPLVVIVTLANLEFSAKQQQGWSYIKAGY